MRKGKIPQIWKHAKVTPIFKAGDPTDVSNYRPISVIPIIMKVFERTIHNQLSSYLNQTNLLYAYQSGFRSKFSTETALIDVTEYIINGFDSGELVGAIMLDLKKAFDTVDPDILTQKLQWFGVSNIPLSWFKDYLSDRNQLVQFKSELSNERPIKCGVPQGSILGPLLFILYVNDLPKVCSKTKVILYADDTAILCRGKSIAQIQKTLNSEMGLCSVWFTQNKLHLNVSKTKSMLFGTSQRLSSIKAPDNFEITVCEEVVERVQVFKYLGVHMDVNLNWHTHVEKIAKKISSKIGILRRVKPYLTIDLSKMIYNSIVLPHFTYCNIIWASTDETTISRLQNLQNTSARVILTENKRSHVQPMLDVLSWMPISSQTRYHTLVAVYKCTHGLVPSYLHKTFIQISRIHSYSTRQANQSNLFTRRPTLSQYKRSFTYRGVVLWNQLPEQIRSAETLNTFKAKLTAYIAPDFCH